MLKKDELEGYVYRRDLTKSRKKEKKQEKNKGFEEIMNKKTEKNKFVRNIQIKF